MNLLSVFTLFLAVALCSGTYDWRDGQLPLERLQVAQAGYESVKNSETKGAYRNLVHAEQGQRRNNFFLRGNLRDARRNEGKSAIHVPCASDGTLRDG
uniref:Uncharacterized protein n=1 Tax=Caenorhabditis japonica TaxID=281687 RepID=A0A8R1DKL6_CAEJA